MGWPTIQYEPPPLYFMHVRKTAGTAWHNVLMSAYHPQAVKRITVPNLPDYSLADLKRFRTRWSHFGPGLLPCIDRCYRRTMWAHTERAWRRGGRNALGRRKTNSVVPPSI